MIPILYNSWPFPVCICRGVESYTISTSVSYPDPVGSVSLGPIRIRIHFRKRWSGSGSTSGNVDLDPDPLQETLIWIFMSLKTFYRKKLEFGIQNRTRIRIRYPGSVYADPDPHQNEADPKLWYLLSISVSMAVIKSTNYMKALGLNQAYM